MRKPNISLLVTVTLIFMAFTLGFLLGRNNNEEKIIVSVADDFLTKPTEEIPKISNVTEKERIIFPISLNSAGKQELMALPGIGEVLAERILDYRRVHGAFATEEELLNVEGIGKNRLEEILDLITVGG